MAVRIYMSPQITSGAMTSNLLNQLINPAAGDHFQELDNPSRKMSLCCLWASDATHATVVADSRITAVSPLYADDAALHAGMLTLVNSLPGIAAIKTKLETLGINTAWISGTNTLHEALRYLMRVHAVAQIAWGGNAASVLTFLANNLDTTVGNVPAAVRNAVRDWMQARGLAIGWINNSSTVREVVHFIVENLGIGILRMANREF